MRAQIDQICKRYDVWPHAVLSAHAHNYQRLTRTIGSIKIPYVIAGCGGHGIASFLEGRAALLEHGGLVQVGKPLAEDVDLETFDDKNYGYLRVKADEMHLTIEYRQPQTKGDHTLVADKVIVDLQTRELVPV